MGKVTVFTADECADCSKAKELLSSKGVQLHEISLTKNPDWKPLLFILAEGRTNPPLVFFNERLIGGFDDLQKLEAEGKLDQMIKECLESPDSDFPPPCRKPEGIEFVKLIPNEVQEKWQKQVDGLDAKLGGTPERPIELMIVSLDTPDYMTSICSAGPATADDFQPGIQGIKGHESTCDMMFCQVAMKNKTTLLVDDLSKFPMCTKNEDVLNFNFCYYVGAPWFVGNLRGTVLAFEKEPNILREEHKAVMEAVRDVVEKDFKEYLATH